MFFKYDLFVPDRSGISRPVRYHTHPGAIWLGLVTEKRNVRADQWIGGDRVAPVQLAFYLFLTWSQQTCFHRDGCRDAREGGREGETDEMESNLQPKGRRGLVWHSQRPRGVDLMLILNNFCRKQTKKTKTVMSNLSRQHQTIQFCDFSASV